MDTTSSTPSLADTAPATLFLALELSRSTWLVALHSPVVDKVSLHRLDGGDVEGLIARKQGQAEEKLGRPVRVACCFEAGYDGFWLHRWLCARGVENRVLDAANLLVDRRARRAKTDRLDAAGLLPNSTESAGEPEFMDIATGSGTPCAAPPGSGARGSGSALVP
jgi:transposase